VRDLLRTNPAYHDRRRHVRTGPPPKLTPAHAAFLTSPLTLQKWACKTLAERAVLFHRRFPESKISRSSLHRLYQSSGIKRKALKFMKTMKYQTPEKRNLQI
jgi:hypothetical protein